MSKLLEWIKANAKEGANIAEAEELVQKSTFDGITTKEQAADFISKNAAFKSALDSAISTAVQNHDDKFKAEKLPKLMEEEKKKIQQELNPDETPEQKRIRELEERDRQREAAFQLNERKAALRDIAAELKIDHKRAERYAVFGDDAEKMLREDAEYQQSLVQSAVESTKKEIYGGNEPPQGREIPEDKILSREAFEKLSPADQMKAVTKDGMIIQD